MKNMDCTTRWDLPYSEYRKAMKKIISKMNPDNNARNDTR